MKITVYHGGTEPIEYPICHLGRANLDFGQGFYVTGIKEQACQWAATTAAKRNANPVVSIFQLDKEAILAEAHCKLFEAYDTEWLEFIVACRKGENPSRGYDYIEGGIANDRVIDTVNLYIAGLMSADIALQRLAQHQPNNQICLLNQYITDKYLVYERCEYL